MRFFVPTANDTHHSEELYQKIRTRIGGSRGDLSDRRIYSLKYQRDGTPATLTVGGSCTPLGEDGPVLAIFETEHGAHYICTPQHGGFEGEPLHLEQGRVSHIEDFSALA